MSTRRRYKTSLMGLLSFALILTSCSIAPSDKVIEALGKDPATVCIKGHGVYGVGNADLIVARTNITNGTVKCSDDGLTIQSTPPSIPVGVQVVPTK